MSFSLSHRDEFHISTLNYNTIHYTFVLHKCVDIPLYSKDWIFLFFFFSLLYDKQWCIVLSDSINFAKDLGLKPLKPSAYYKSEDRWLWRFMLQEITPAIVANTMTEIKLVEIQQTCLMVCTLSQPPLSFSSFSCYVRINHTHLHALSCGHVGKKQSFLLLYMRL